MTKSRKKKSFVVCLSNDGYAASLEPRKIYVALRDAAAERNGLLRVVDESGDDYLYSRERFAPLKLPRGLQQPLAAAAEPWPCSWRWPRKASLPGRSPRSSPGNLERPSDRPPLDLAEENKMVRAAL